MKILPHLLALLVLGTSLLNAQNQTRNKGAGIKTELLDAYQALNFQGMPYRFLLPENYDPGKKYPLILNLHGRAVLAMTMNRKCAIGLPFLSMRTGAKNIPV